ncbi:hypothetical protein M3Y96_00326800 [Aphelenchoides besseyi]|nr:hypothetical protein M3Y96_00326800 [Aphelenchoides besseyi]
MYDGIKSANSTLTLEVVDFNQLKTFGLQYRAWIKEWSDTHIFTPNNRVFSIDQTLSSNLAFCSTLIFHVEIRSVLNKFALNVSNTCWQQNLESMFDNQEYSDAVVQTKGDESFKIHKAILCSQSYVFKTMFQHDCKEKESSEIVIANADVEVVESMLLFIYSGKVEKIDVLASRLILLADQYELKDLTAMCMHQLGQDVNTSNVIERLELLSLVDHLTAYTEPVFKFLQENYEVIRKTPEWLSFSKTHNKLFTHKERS